MSEHYNAAAWLVDRHVEAGDDDRTAIICGSDQQSYGELQRQVWRAQNALSSLGVRRGERVAMVVNDEPAFPAWFLGAMRSGAVPVPVSTMLNAEELGVILEDADAPMVVASAMYADRVDKAAARAPSLQAAVFVGEPAAPRSAAETAGAATLGGEAPGGGTNAPKLGLVTHQWDDFTDIGEAPVAGTKRDTPAFWLYSSGTTGLPKGVMHRHANLEATAATYARSVLRITPDDRCFSVAKLFFAYGLGNSLTFPFSVGGTAVLDPGRPTPQGVAQLLTDERPTMFFASPGFVAALLDADLPDDTFASVRVMVTAGESLPAELHRRFTSRWALPVLDGIGSTEALHIFLSNHEGAERPGTSGTPVDGYEAKLLGEDGSEITEPDAPGFLHVKGESNASGYWCRTDASRTNFCGEWLRTGDVYTRSADGYWTFLGRNNDMMKVGGMWVSPAEVEGVLVEHPDVSEAAVIGSRTADGLETAVAFLVPRSGRSIDPADVDAHCRERMAAFKRPRQVHIVDSLPKTATGKVQRFLLREQLADAAPT